MEKTIGLVGTPVATKAFAFAGLGSIMTIATPYIPFIFGGLTLFSYMVSHEEIKLNIKNLIVIVGGAVLIGYLTKPITMPLAEGIYGVLVNMLPIKVVENSEAIKSGSAIIGISNTMSYILGFLSKSIYSFMYSNRKDIVGKIAKKTISKKGEGDE